MNNPNNMNHDLTFIILLFLMFMSYVLIRKSKNKTNLHQKNNLFWKQCNKNDPGTRLFRKVMNMYNINKNINNNQNWDIYLPCNNDFSNKSIYKIQTNNNNQMIAYIHNNRIIGSKQMIWDTLEKYYGRKQASTIMPNSYLMTHDINKFKQDYNNNYYILKSEQQRQKGLKITNNYNEILNCKKKKYVVVQEYLNNPFTFHNYKVNFRIYLLIISDNNYKNAYVYDDGIISYAKNKMNSHTNKENGISSFYSSKKLYNNGFPITLKNMMLKNKNIHWNHIMKLFSHKIKKLLKACLPVMCEHKFNYNNTSFQLFGVDLFLNNNFNDAKILEVNIGPGMTPYKNEDKKMRTSLHIDIMKLLKIIKSDNSNGFTKII